MTDNLCCTYTLRGDDIAKKFRVWVRRRGLKQPMVCGGDGRHASKAQSLLRTGVRTSAQMCGKTTSLWLDGLGQSVFQTQQAYKSISVPLDQNETAQRECAIGASNPVMQHSLKILQAVVGSVSR